MARYLALAKTAGVLPVVVLTKADPCDDVSARLDQLQARLPKHVHRVALNATDPDSLLSLLAYLGEGTTAVLLGSSGAGKSTLTNALSGAEVQPTGAFPRTGWRTSTSCGARSCASVRTRSSARRRRRR